MDFQTIRIYGSLFVILGCFVFLYPKLVHPLFLNILGWNEKPEPRNEMNDLPPPLRGKHPDLAAKANEVPDHIKRMRQHGPHPGMRAAAAEQKQTKGSGRGMMGVILPMYAVGIVVYLVYTLFKVFGKNDNKEPKSAKSSPVRETPYGTNFNDDPDDMDMRKLQERLAETEAQMTKILAAMQSVQTKVGDVGEKVKTATNSGSNTDSGKEKEKPNESEEKKDTLNTSDRSSESSPESDSYEIVNKSDRESNGEDTLPQKVETLTSNTNQEEVQQEQAEEDGDEGEDDDVEPREEIIKDKEPEDEEITTVRKRVTKKDEDS